ncbi:cytochrome bc complex cytochrome b subunit [bacterium BMS3Bbin04]|nr:cytochrome bc complex cytochrome b subunit [bacterium BMS3Bbin04]
MKNFISAGGLTKWFNERVSFEGMVEHVKHKTVPEGKHFIWYFFGGSALFFFIVQVVTGLFLLLYYKPTPASAYESVHFIESEVAFGWLIRNVHAWSSNLMILSLFFHMFSNWFTKGFRKPRELTWITGVFLLIMAMGFGFTGYLLPWNKLSFFATKVGTEIAASTPFIGDFLVRFLRGGEEVTGATLTRLFAIHVTVLPLLAAMFVGIHLYFVQAQGMSHALGEKLGKEMKFFPDFVYREIAVWSACLLLLAFLAVYFPFDSVFISLELQEKASAFDPTPMGIKPEWYFMFMFQSLKYFPGSILGMDGRVAAVMFFSFGALVLIALPFWDVWAHREKRHWFPMVVGVGILIFIIVLTTLGYLDTGH